MFCKLIHGTTPLLRTATTFFLCSTSLLSGCGLLPASAPSATPSRASVAYVVVGKNGTAWARVITPGSTDASCPLVTVDGTTQRMTVRAAAATIAQRKTASDAANSKPAAFPVLTCEYPLPENARSATIVGVTLPLPKANPRRIVVLGDTGCRMKKADNAWQACIDNEAWPFRAVADAAAAMAPDLVIHVGDYHYRENACPPDIVGCQGSPWGYGWDTWQADFFDPASKLLAAAPWVVARGNHEECQRAGQGWFRFLDPLPFEEQRSCNEAQYDSIGNFTPPYPIPLSREVQLIVFDSAASGHQTLNPKKARDAHTFAQYRQQFMKVDELAGKAGVNSIFVNHHPILGYAPRDEFNVYAGSPAQLSVMKSLHPLSYYPASVTLALHGHVHLFEALNFSSKHPATIVSGMGGDELDAKLPDPFPSHIAHAEGVTLERITHSAGFGFVVMDKQEKSWQISAYDHRGLLKTTCILTGSKLRCDKTGLVK